MATNAELDVRVAKHPLMSLGYGVTTASAEALYNEVQELVQEAQDELLSADDTLLPGFVEETNLGKPIEFQAKAVDQIMGLAQHGPIALVAETRLELNVVDESSNLTVPLGAAAALASLGFNLIDLLQQGSDRCDRTLSELHYKLQGLTDSTRSYALEQGGAVLKGLQEALSQYDSATGSMTLPPIEVKPTVKALKDARPFAKLPQRNLTALMQEVVDSPQRQGWPEYASLRDFKVMTFALDPDYVPDTYTLEDIVISPEDFQLELKCRTELNLVLNHERELILGGQGLHFISRDNIDQLLADVALNDIMALLQLQHACSAALALTDTYMEFHSLCRGLRPLTADELTEVLKAPPPPVKPAKVDNHGADLAALKLAISMIKAKADSDKMPSQAELNKILGPAVRPSPKKAET